jgi:hypothetical protein
MSLWRSASSGEIYPQMKFIEKLKGQFLGLDAMQLMFNHDFQLFIQEERLDNSIA